MFSVLILPFLLVVVFVVYLCGAGECAELAEGDDEVVEDVAHGVVGGDGGTAPEAVHGPLHVPPLTTPVQDKGEGSHRGAPRQREQVVVEQAPAHTHEHALAARAPPQQHLKKQSHLLLFGIHLIQSSFTS